MEEFTKDELEECDCGEAGCEYCDRCDHEGYVFKGRCEKCGERDLFSDDEIYAREAPR
jgi:hypothetical protein